MEIKMDIVILNFVLVILMVWFKFLIFIILRYVLKNVLQGKGVVNYGVNYYIKGNV